VEAHAAGETNGFSVSGYRGQSKFDGAKDLVVSYVCYTHDDVNFTDLVYLQAARLGKYLGPITYKVGQTAEQRPQTR